MTGTEAIAVVLAGGRGARMGAALPKQLLPVGGRSPLERVVDTFAAVAAITEVVVVMAPEHLDAARAAVGDHPRVTAVIAGGDSRTDSSRRALAWIGEREAKVLVHDAARALVQPDLVQACLDALDEHDAVVPVVPVVDTLVRLTTDGAVADAVPRQDVVRVQTPQGFDLAVLREAYAAAGPDAVHTDDAGVVLGQLPSVRVQTVPGQESNLKLTVPADVAVAEALLREAAP